MNKKSALQVISLVLVLLGIFLVASAYGRVTSPGISPAGSYDLKGGQEKIRGEGKTASGQVFNNGAISGGCACCGSSNPETEGTTGKAEIKNDFQEATIKVNGGYDPQILTVKAGVPLRLTFTKGTSSCDSVIILPFAGNLKVDVTNGPKTIELPALEAGEYDYSCWMGMLNGKIIAR